MCILSRMKIKRIMASLRRKNILKGHPVSLPERPISHYCWFVVGISCIFLDYDQKNCWPQQNGLRSLKLMRSAATFLSHKIVGNKSACIMNIHFLTMLAKAKMKNKNAEEWYYASWTVAKRTFFFNSKILTHDNFVMYLKKHNISLQFSILAYISQLSFISFMLKQSVKMSVK